LLLRINSITLASSDKVDDQRFITFGYKSLQLVPGDITPSAKFGTVYKAEAIIDTGHCFSTSFSYITTRYYLEINTGLLSLTRCTCAGINCAWNSRLVAYACYIDAAGLGGATALKTHEMANMYAQNMHIEKSGSADVIDVAERALVTVSSSTYTSGAATGYGARVSRFSQFRRNNADAISGTTGKIYFESTASGIAAWPSNGTMVGDGYGAYVWTG